MEPLTLGVEEEFLVVDRTTGALVPRSDDLLPGARKTLGEEVAPELNLCQIEVGTPVCNSLDQVRSHLIRLRQGLGAAAEDIGIGIIAAGTHPFSSWQRQQVDVSNQRYSRMDDVYQIVARQQVICGCHVHVGIDDQDLAIATMSRARPWLPVLLALSANSPFWQGLDTGYASYRLQVWQRWPTSGMPPELQTREEFDDLVGALESIDAIEDATFLYWYVRPSIRYPTLEFRVCDVCLDVEETVAVAGLVRSLAWTCAQEALRNEEPNPARLQVMEASTWRAARYGLSSMLVSPLTLTARPAALVVSELLDYVRKGLEAHGDWNEVSDLVNRVLARGNGASRQRMAFGRRHNGHDVVNHILEETIPSTG
jgi:carboxylate-amine ligase